MNGKHDKNRNSPPGRRAVSAHLSNDLAGQYSVRTVPIRTGDSVRVLRGEFAGLEGKVDRIDRASSRVFVEGMTREKTAGAGASSRLTVHSSKVMLTTLNMSDKWRSSLLEDKSKNSKEREQGGA